MSHQNSYKLPSTRADNYNAEQVNGYLSQIHADNKNSGFGVCQYAHGLGTLPSTDSLGGVYSPTQNRIYFAPFARSNLSTWLYMDLNTGLMVEYTHGQGTIAQYAYQGGVYSPLQDRIYFCPYKISGLWHYVDCKTGLVGSYAAEPTYFVDYANWGGVYLPSLNRIYYTTYAQWDNGHINYVDCSTGLTGTYDAGFLTTYAYQGACYSPTQNRIYLAPCNITGGTWHYIDGSTGNLVGYTAGSGGLHTVAYGGAVYSPIQNRIYFIPSQQAATEASWHYIDCNTGEAVAYTHGATIPTGQQYVGGVYSPVTNRIYMVPSGTASSIWHYIDCNTGAIVPYNNGVTTVTYAYQSGVYSPLQNRVYFIPHFQSTEPMWHYIQEYTSSKVSPTLMAGGTFNKY